MESSEAATWTRHFDTLLWQVTSIFASAIGALLAYSYSDFHLPIAIAGLFFTIIPIYFGASFRELRYRMSKHLDMSIQNALSEGRSLYQWQFFVSIFIAFQLLWVMLLTQKLSQFWMVWVLLGFMSFAVSVWLAFIGKHTVDKTV